jgi:hypothetical protein
MQNNKDQKMVDDVMQTFMHLMKNPDMLSSIFGGSPSRFAEKEEPYESLGNGYELRPIEILAEGGQFVVENREKYSHLYWNGSKVCDLIFRKGGMGGEFKDGYCSLIQYTQKEPHTQKNHGFDFGIHVIINEQGIIRMSGTGISYHPSHCGGNIGKLKDTYYDLRTGEEILTASSSGAISSKNLIIIEHRYDWYNKSLPLGVYTINKTTCEITKIDDTK